MTGNITSFVADLLPESAGSALTHGIDPGVLLVTGLALCFAGCWWIARLTVASGAPRPHHTRPHHRSQNSVDQVSIQEKRRPRDVAGRQRNDDGRTVARFRPGLPAAHHPSFVQLYYALEARRTSVTASMIVQFLSASAGAGVSTVASGYARVAAAGRPAPVLFIDAACRGGKHGFAVSDAPTLVEAFEGNHDLDTATVPARNADNLLWARLCDHPDALLSLGADRLQDLVSALAARHQLIVLDSASIQRPEAAALSRYCDGSLLVVEAGATSQSQIDLACRRIKQLGGVAVGVVLNRERGASAASRVQFA
jgi:Mrp family chromosome partitioning ATPase